MGGPPDFAKFEEDKKVKREVVRKAIIDQCNDDSALAEKFESIKAVRDSVSKNGAGFLNVETIADGMTNFGYKIFLEDDREELRYAMFGKLAFPYAMWLADEPYDVSRLQNELTIMKQFDELCPHQKSVSTPYFCVKIDDMMLLVTGWCKNDIPHHEQLRAGKLDQRLAPKLGTSLAKLHSITDFDPDFNDLAREPLKKGWVAYDEDFSKLLENVDDTSRTATALRKVGMTKIRAALAVHYNELCNVRKSLIHSDYHSYNILTEQKNGDEFGPDGSFVLIDWEMANAGPTGRDMGLFHAFMLFFPLAHAIHNGNFDPVQESLVFLDSMWDAYVKELRAGGRDEAFISYTARSTLAWCGWYTFIGIYLYGVHFKVFPIDYEKEGDCFRDALGHVSHQFYMIGFGGDDTALSSADEYRQKMKDIYLKEIEFVKNDKR